MREKIEGFSKGEFEYELPILHLSENEITRVVEAGKTIEGSISISNSLGRQMKGTVYSSNRLLKLKPDSFCGTDCSIRYLFHADFANPPVTILGEITIVSDCGERAIPFEIQVEQPSYRTDLGKIKDLFQFANLARTDWAEAKRIFRDSDFERVFLRNEEQYCVLYRGLLKSSSMSQALEEFLIAIHKKLVVRFQIDKTNVEHLVTEEGLSARLLLTTEQWGYAELRISTDAPFIQLEQKFLWADRFIDHQHPVSYFIDPKQMRKGNNYGHIWIKTAHQTITVNVSCRRSRYGSHKVSDGRQLQKLEFGLIDHYLSFRLNQIDLMQFLEGAGEMLKKLPTGEVSSIRELFKIYMAIISGKNSLAGELLEDLAVRKEHIKKQSLLEYCCYLYLKALYDRDKKTIQEAAGSIRKIYENELFDWKLLWFLLYTDKQYEENKALKLNDIKAQFNAGCRSPILYYEAVCIYNEEPVLLRELNSFEIQVMNFGLKFWFLTKDVMQQFTYLAGKRKTFHPVIYRGLVRLYQENGSKETLSAICGLLIKGMKKSEKYFEWYQRGVEAQLRITELYEYYMYSVNVNRQEPLAQPVLLYFIYNSSLNDRKTSFLFANITKYKDKNPSLYRTYLKKMEIFAAKMLEAHLINRDLAVLYREFFFENLLGSNQLEHLPYVMYRQELTCQNPVITSVVVLRKEFGTLERFPLIEGCAQINLYSGDEVIFLEDSEGRLYYESIDYQITPLLNAEDYESRCLGSSKNPWFLLHLCQRYQKYRVMNETAIKVRQQVLQIDGLTKEYKNECYCSLIDYCYEYNKDELLEFYLKQIDLTLVKPSERDRYLEYMVLRTCYDLVMRSFYLFSYDEISINRLVKLCSGYIMMPESEPKQNIMVDLCYYVFSRNKYDEAILDYLVRLFRGSTKEMLRLWQVAKDFERNTHDLEERILTQMLFTQSSLEESYLVFDEYYKNVTNPLLVRAYLTCMAYRYLVHDHLPEPGLFLIMKRELNYEENDICLLAWLKYHQEDPKLSEQELLFVEYQIDRLVKKGLVLPFFTRYQGRIELPQQIINKYYITYVANPNQQVFLHYSLWNGQHRHTATERMKHVFLGIHVKEFLLFHHEVLQYYIRSESPKGIVSTEEVQIQYDGGIQTDEDTKYHRINRMIEALEIQEEDTLLDRMEEYSKMEYMITSCFQHIKE